MALYDAFNSLAAADGNLALPAGIISRRAETFAAQYSYSCQNFRLRLSRVGSPGTITARLYDTSAVPSAGTLRGSATYDGNTLTTSTSGEWAVFDFGTAISIVQGTIYWLLLETPSNGDASNYVNWRYDNDNGYSYGTFYYYFGSWSFTPVNDAFFEMHDAYSSAPSKATNPSPSNAATGVNINLSSLDWTLGANASTEDVYFGESGNLSVVDTLNNTETFNLSAYLPLSYNTSYQWRIDSTNQAGTTTGDTWSFTTTALNSPDPTDFQFKKRLTAAARRTFWYEDI